MWVGVRPLVSDEAKITLWRKKHTTILVAASDLPQFLSDNTTCFPSSLTLSWPDQAPAFPHPTALQTSLSPLPSLTFLLIFLPLHIIFIPETGVFKCLITLHGTTLCGIDPFELCIRLYCQVLAKSLRPLCCSGACPCWLMAQILPLVL